MRAAILRAGILGLGVVHALNYGTVPPNHLANNANGTEQSLLNIYNEIVAVVQLPYEYLTIRFGPPKENPDQVLASLIDQLCVQWGKLPTNDELDIHTGIYYPVGSPDFDSVVAAAISINPLNATEVSHQSSGELALGDYLQQCISKKSKLYYHDLDFGSRGNPLMQSMVTKYNIVLTVGDNSSRFDADENAGLVSFQAFKD